MENINPSPEAVGKEPDRDVRALFRRLLAGIPRPEFRPPRISGRRLWALAALVLLVWASWRFLKGSTRKVEPGFAGICVNRLTGSLEALPPGAYWLPRALYDLHPIRVSDQLLSGAVGSFSVSTKEGVSAQLTVQARWSLDRRRLLSKWAALPADPARELVAPIIASAFRSAAPSYEVRQLVGDKREELAAVAARTARLRLSESGVMLK